MLPTSLTLEGFSLYLWRGMHLALAQAGGRKFTYSS